MFIFRAIKKIIAIALKTVYRLLCVFNLQFTILVVLVGILLWALGVFENGGLPLILFVIVFIGSIVLALVITARKILGLDKPKNKQSKIQILTDDKSAQVVQSPIVPPVENVQVTNANQYVVQPQQNIIVTEEVPKYYRVKQNNNYVMAEYSNRYELFLITPNGLKKIRTDYKR